ncbi:hypothetical protein BDR26DRAFT_862121 [Obelidium mucronatum]|nr:hypothetical protein BDR26DRAFT_862121 [Obelidium mucronatum]
MVIVLQKRVFKEHAWVFVCVATAVSGIFALLPPIFRAQYSLQPSKVYCAIEWENRGILAVIIISIGLILTPVGLICFAYVKIYVVMVHSVWDVKRAVSKDEVSKVTAHTIEESEGKGAGAAGATENGTTSHIDDHQKALLVQSMVIVAAFLIGWTPYLILIFWELLTQRVASPLFDFLAVYCVILNQIINPSILFCYNKEIRSNVIACFSNH